MTGLTIPQEYVCLDLFQYDNPLSVFLSFRDGAKVQEVTDSHLFLGYKPVIIGLSFRKNCKVLQSFAVQNKVCLTFSISNSDKSDDTSTNKLASLHLRAIGERQMDDNIVLFFEGINGRHSFLNSFNQLINRRLNRKKTSSGIDISLEGNLYDQVRIAYSLPRVISIITVGDGGLINMFPTDLHGSVEDKFYVSSLRIGGKANEQVEKFKNIVISDVNASFYKYSYGLGKNHMKEMQEREKFLTDNKKSDTFSLPLPVGVSEYRELTQFDSFDHGIHTIHIYKVINHVTLQDKSKLVHIHQYFSQWRSDHGLTTHMLLR